MILLAAKLFELMNDVREHDGTWSCRSWDFILVLASLYTPRPFSFVREQFRKLAASNTCGYCNNFGYKWLSSKSDNKVNQKWSNIREKNHESGVYVVQKM